MKRAAQPQGFTLLELLVTLTILATAMSVIIGAFTVTLRGWNRGGELLEDLHHGDFVMEQLVSALRSTAFLQGSPEKYGFWLDDQGGAMPRDTISWVTSGTAFMLPDSPLANGLHRIEIGIEKNDQGTPSVAVRAYPHLAEFEEMESETWFVSSVVQGLDLRVYDEKTETWKDEWEDTNAIPSLVEVTLYMEPLEKYDPPVKMSRLVEIPLAPMVASAVRFEQEDAANQQALEEEQQQPPAENPGMEEPAPQPGPADGGEESELVDSPTRFEEQLGPEIRR